MREFAHNQHIGVSRRRSHVKREPNPACRTGGFYIHPTAGQTVNAGQSFPVKWDTTCLDIAKADIYLYAPGAESTRIYLWEGVDFKSGSYDVTLKPKWWNSTTTASLQFAIVETHGGLFMNEYPAGPIFTANYDKNAGLVSAADADTAKPDAGYTIIKEPEPQSSKSGKIAAGVLIPLLFIAAGVAIWVYITRRKNKARRRRASVAIDKRMSTISTDWKPMSAAGATAAIRHSMAIAGEPGNRSSSAFSFGAIRPHSTITIDSGNAGVGARRLYNLEGENGSRMSQVRVSRVSFADQTRPSMESRRAAGTSRAFHSAYIPPLPTRKDTDDNTLSPTQTAGALPLSDETIQAKVNAGFEDVLPALSLMHTDNGSGMLLPESSLQPPSPVTPITPITPPAPAHPKSPVVGMMPMPSLAVMSPDEMLRAYAERRPNTPGIQSSASHNPSAPVDSNGMRVLYSPPTSPPPVATPLSAVPLTRKSVAPTVGSCYSNEDDGCYDGFAK